MKKIVAILLTVLLFAFGIIGCRSNPERPIAGFQNAAGAMNITEIKRAGENDKCIGIEIEYVNYTDSAVSFSTDSLLCYYDEEIVGCTASSDFPLARAKEAVKGTVYFTVPLGVNTIKIEYSIPDSNEMAIFSFKIKDN